MFRGYAPVPRDPASRQGPLPCYVRFERSNSFLSPPAETSDCSGSAAESCRCDLPPAICELDFGRGIVGHGSIAAQGGFEPQRSEERLLRSIRNLRHRPCEVRARLTVAVSSPQSRKRNCLWPSESSSELGESSAAVSFHSEGTAACATQQLESRARCIGISAASMGATNTAPRMLAKA